MSETLARFSAGITNVKNTYILIFRAAQQFNTSLSKGSGTLRTSVKRAIELN
jgi:hypothetical protein